MKNKIKLLSFFTALFITFGITSLDFENLALEDNIRGYGAIALGLILLVFFVVIKKRERA